MTRASDSGYNIRRVVLAANRCIKYFIWTSQWRLTENVSALSNEDAVPLF